MILLPNWRYKKINERVLRVVHRYHKFLSIVKTRDIQYLGNMLHDTKYSLLLTIMIEKVVGTGRLVQKCFTWWPRNFRAWTGLLDRSFGCLYPSWNENIKIERSEKRRSLKIRGCDKYFKELPYCLFPHLFWNTILIFYNMLNFFSELTWNLYNSVILSDS